MHAVRRCVERGAGADGSVSPAAVAMTRGQTVCELLELIAALDRRVPQVHRSDEASIARDAATLKDRALRRIAQLEREPRPIDEPL